MPAQKRAKFGPKSTKFGQIWDTQRSATMIILER